MRLLLDPPIPILILLPLLLTYYPRFQTLQDMVNMDIRFNYFNAYRKEEVYNNNNRVNSYGGNDYWESAVFAPQVVLQDLVKIFHPELMADHSFVYYKHLE